MANEEMDLDLDLDLDGNEGADDLALDDDLDLGGDDLGADLGDDLDFGDDLGSDDLGSDDLGGVEDLDLGEDLDQGGGEDLDMDLDADMDFGEEPSEVSSGGGVELDMSDLEAELGVDASEIPQDDDSGDVMQVDSDDDLESELASLNEDLILDESMEVRDAEAADEDLGDLPEIEDDLDLGEEDLEAEGSLEGADMMEADFSEPMGEDFGEDLEPLADELSGDELEADLGGLDAEIDDSFDADLGADELDRLEEEEEDFEEPPTLPEDTLVDLSEKEMDLKGQQKDLLEEELDQPLPDDFGGVEMEEIGGADLEEEELEMPGEYGFDDADEDEQFAALEEVEDEMADLEETEDDLGLPEVELDADFGGGDEADFGELEEPEEEAFGGYDASAEDFDSAAFEEEDDAFGDLEEPMDDFAVGIEDEESDAFEIQETASPSERMKVDLGGAPLAAMPPQSPSQSVERPDAEGLVGKSLLYRIPHQLKVEVGQANLTGDDLTRLNYGSVIQLDRKIGDPVDIVLGGAVIAKGEVVQINEDQLGVRITRIDF